MTAIRRLYRWDDLAREALSPTISRQMVTGERVMLAHIHFVKGAIVPKHSHENEQFTYIIRGHLRFWIGDDETDVVDVRAGDLLHLPSHVPHKAEAIEDTLDMDVFAPPRQDWLAGDDAYLRG